VKNAWFFFRICWFNADSEYKFHVQMSWDSRYVFNGVYWVSYFNTDWRKVGSGVY